MDGLEPAARPESVLSDSYAAFLVCQEIDGFGHNAVFAAEIGAALAEDGLRFEVIDYRREIPLVQAALRDKNCAFFVSFNGFGCELSLANNNPGELTSAFGYFGKPLFDLMHDCPVHESMAHQIRILDPIRHVFITDYGYLQDAVELGLPQVRFAPSITFPFTLSLAARANQNRPIQILLPVQLPPPSVADTRFIRSGNYRQRVLREIYQAVTDRCVADLALDPRVETRRACREADICFEVAEPDCRFLLTGILDFTKFRRRQMLIQALKGLPVTLVTNTPTDADLPDGFSTVPARSFRDLLELMTEATCVLCPLPHMTGFHERALGAFTAGAAVIAAPNAILEMNFRHGREMWTYRSAAELAEGLPRLLKQPDMLRAMGASGQRVALDRFAPSRVAGIMASAWRLGREGGCG